MVELFFVGTGLALIATVSIAAYAATRQRLALVRVAHNSVMDFLEQENMSLKEEVKRLSSRPPPMLGSETQSVLIPVLPEVRTSFHSRGSIIPPPPDYLFELPKRVVGSPVFPARIPSLPPAPPKRDFVEEEDEEVPPTLRTNQCEAIAKSLRPSEMISSDPGGT